MVSIQNINPFRPGTGALPPYLAGREDEQNLFKTLMGGLSVGVSPPAPTVLYGPRGMGKTTLLRWFKNEVEGGVERHDSIRLVWTTPNQLKSPSQLWNLLVPSDVVEGNLSPDDVNAGFNLGVVSGNFSWKSSDLLESDNQKILMDQCKKNPLILLMDEAHKMDVDMCNDLLNIHRVISPESPFMLVLAGTPGLNNFLRTVGATFVERSEMISLGRLDAQSAADAVSKPFEDEGIEITNDALSIIVEDSQCYPYFLQVWGKSIWMEANKENLTCITEEQVAIVKLDITTIKNKFYDERRDTLKKLELQSTTVAIAKAFQDTKAMTDNAIMEIIRDNLSVDLLNTLSAVERQQTFIDNDFIWKGRKSTLYEPGIPSLMTYILDSEKN